MPSVVSTDTPASLSSSNGAFCAIGGGGGGGGGIGSDDGGDNGGLSTTGVGCSAKTNLSSMLLGIVISSLDAVEPIIAVVISKMIKTIHPSA